jgi:predicted metal-dependent hydrolase
MAPERIQVGDLWIQVTRKNIKNVHLSVYPPDGRVTLSAPADTRLDAARAYAVSKLGWIRRQQKRLRQQVREPRRQYVTRESHYLWGRRYLLAIVESNTRPRVVLDHKRITLHVRPGSRRDKRAEILHEWHKRQLHDIVPGLIEKWEPRIGVKVAGYYLQRMKTKWGSCNPGAGTIRLNTELVKKPRDLLEYVVVHEMIHLLEPVYGDRFITLLSQHCPAWQVAGLELNELPVAGLSV